MTSIRLNNNQLSDVPRILQITYNPSTENSGLQFIFDKPVLDNCYLQVARLCQRRRKYNRTSNPKEGAYEGYRMTGRHWAPESIPSMASLSIDPIMVIKGSTTFTIPFEQFESRFRPDRCSSHQNNSVNQNKKNTNYYKFCLCTYKTPNYKRGELSRDILKFKHYIENPTKPKEEHIINKSYSIQ